MPTLLQRLLAAAVLLAVCGLGVAHAQLAPDEELQSLSSPVDAAVTLFASEPMIANPAAIDVDAHGRVWVAEIQWYRRAAKDPPADKIKVLEDTDGDGRADRVTVFAEGLFCPMSVCVAGAKVYVATSPDLWVYEDADGDLRADGPPRRLLTGFGGHNHDHGAHSLVLGPDHKWWMAHGDGGFDLVGTDNSRAAFPFGAVLRGELDGGRLETVAVNFRNPYEVCVSSFGEAYLSDNDNDGNESARICWILDGGDYGWFGAPPPRVPPGTPAGEHWHFRGFQPGFVPATLVTGFGSPCGICFYEGDAFGPALKNTAIHADAGPREVRSYRHENHGAGKTAQATELLTATDGYFRPDDVCAAPDGSLFVSDWYDGGVGGHNYNDPHRGRIFLVRPSAKQATPSAGPGPDATVADAIAALKSPNLATQFLARERLLARGDEAAQALTTLAAEADDPNHRARAYWLLDRLGGATNRHVVVELLDSADPAFRALAVRILRRHGNQYADRLLPLADDPADEVRRETLLALARLPSDAATAALVEIAAAALPADRYFTEAIHIAAQGREAALVAQLDQRGLVSLDRIELLLALDPARGERLLIDALADATRPAAARLAALSRLGALDSAAAAESVIHCAADASASEELRRAALEVLDFNFSHRWKDQAQGDALEAALASALDAPSLARAAMTLASNHRVGSLGPALIAVARNASQSIDARCDALAAASALGAPGLADALDRLLVDPSSDIARAALQAAVAQQHWRPLRAIAAGDVSSPLEFAEVCQAIVASTSGAVLLESMIASDALSPPRAAALLEVVAASPDANVRSLFAHRLPESARPQRLGAAVDAADILALDGDAERGRRIFHNSTAARCAACHRAGGRGAEIGPDLSNIGRKYERAALLETILEPSKAVAPEFVAHVVETAAGQVLVGFITARSDAELTLKDVEGRTTVLAADDVAAIAPQSKSLMPELVLQDMTAQDAADLLAYLATLGKPATPSPPRRGPG